MKKIMGKKIDCQDDTSHEEIEEDISDRKTTIVKIMTREKIGCLDDTSPEEMEDYVCD